ncbi:MAG: hypothetical protein OEY56_01580, partial [Cyclobacteriaceae bacterium]|nr:hypothetical protein [Cyclobacteriaceae bacterium]
MKYQRILFMLFFVSGLFYLTGWYLHTSLAYGYRQIKLRVASQLDQLDRTLDALVLDFSDLTDPFDSSAPEEPSLRVFDNGRLVYWNDNR